MRQFSVVIPVRGTERELGYMPRVMGSVAALEPDEILIALDEGTPKRVEDAIRNACPRDVRFVTIPPDPEWRSNFLHVVYSSYMKARHGLLLCTDADNIVTKDILPYRDIPGTDNIVAVTFAKQMAGRGFHHAYRRLVRRIINPLVSGKVFTGIYWLDRGLWEKVVGPEKLKVIHNGADSVIQKNCNASTVYDYKFVGKVVGARCMDDQTEDYPHVQFRNGVYAGAYMWRPESMKSRKAVRLARRFGTRAVSVTIVLVSFRAVVMYALMNLHPWYLYGFVWAKLHPGHPAVKGAFGKSRFDWEVQFIHEINSIRDWPRSSRERTGFA